MIPADRKWAMRAVVADIISTTIQGMDLHYPVLTPQMKTTSRRLRPPFPPKAASRRTSAVTVLPISAAFPLKGNIVGICGRRYFAGIATTTVSCQLRLPDLAVTVTGRGFTAPSVAAL